MAWFADLSPYTYLRSGESKQPPTLNVGWLASEQPFTTGDVPAELVPRLAALVEHAPTQQTRGVHYCDFCPPASRGQARSAPWGLDDAIPGGTAEIRAVSIAGIRYAAPTLIRHYVAVHHYAPPAAFVDAVLRPQPYTWHEALEQDLCFVCGDTLRRRARYLDFACARCGVNYERVQPGL